MKSVYKYFTISLVEEDKNLFFCLFAVVSQFQKWRTQKLRSRPGKDNTVLKKHFSVYLTLYKSK